MQVHINDQTFATYPRMRRMFACAEKVYRLLIALQPEDASALKWSTDDAARLVELRRVREGALRSNNEDDEASAAQTTEAKAAGDKRTLEVDATSSDIPPALRARVL